GVEDGEIAAMGRQQTQDNDHGQYPKQHEKVQGIKPDQAGAQEGDIAGAGKQVLQPRPIDMGENEARQDEEKFHPEIAAGGKEVEQPDMAVVMALAEMEHHHHQRWKGPRAGQGGDFLRRFSPFFRHGAPIVTLAVTRPSVMGAKRRNQIASFASRLGGLVAHLQSMLGIIAIIALAWALSEDRRAFSWRLAVGTVALQAAIALLLLKVPVTRDALYGLNAVVTAVTTATNAGTSFVFGYMGSGPTPFAVTNPGNLVNLAFTILPLVIVISALAAILWYWRISPLIVHAMALVLKKTLGLGGAVGLSAASMVFLGNMEGQLVIRPYLPRLTRAELFILMTVGLSVIAGTVFVLYATILKPVLPGALGHLLVASMMSLPAGILVARTMVPGPAETDLTEQEESVHYRSTVDAMARGTEDGLRLYLQIIAMLIVTTALVALANVIL